MKKKLFFLFALFLVNLPVINPARAQQNCQPPTPIVASRETNIFSEEQEMFLGEAIAEQLQKDYGVIADAEITGPLVRIGERIIKHLPPNKLRFQFFLVDIPDANAFVLPGGRIYVSRKLVAYVQSEDELAGVIAHEIGHLVARQQAIELTRIMREVIGATQVGDRRDIFEKYNQLVDNAARKPNAFGSRQHHDERKEELTADQIGLFALAAAGYDPQAQAKLFERISEAQGKSGGFFANLFGVVKPEVKRLREMSRNFAALPPGCVERRAAGQSEEFQRWQSAVVVYNTSARKEALPNLISKTVLDPTLRGDVTHLRFSPDGKYVLAQDDAGINVLSREPFAPLFRINAPEANEAQFTPDSQQVVFHTPDLRVERWNVAEGKLKEAQEVVLRKLCLQSELSPDGKTLACLDDDLNLSLIDVATRAQIFQKKDFYTPDPFLMILTSLLKSLGDDESSDSRLELVKMGFSPDGHYFAAGARGVSLGVFEFAIRASVENAALVYDLQTRAPLKLKGQANKLIASGFTFIAPDRLLVQNDEDLKKSGILTLPTGELVEQFPLMPGKLASVANGNYALVRPVSRFAVGVLDIAKREIFKGNKNTAIDLYNDVFVAERVTGELGLYDVAKNELKAKLVLPPSPLGRLRAMTVSPDFRWLAVSERSRGAVWDLQKGERLFHLRGFRGGYFVQQGLLLADFPKQDDMPRQIARLNLSTRNADAGPEVKETRAVQYGPFVLYTKPAKKDGGYFENVSLEMHEAGSLGLLWQKTFQKEAPRVWVDAREGSVALAWPVAAKAAQAEIKSDEKLNKQMAALKEKEGDYLVQVLDARNGNLKGKLLIETGKGSFRLSHVFAANDWLLVSDNQNRVLVYSLTMGEQRGRVFGNRPTVSQANNLLCVGNESGQLTVYDLNTLQKREQFTFTHPVAFSGFSADGQKLFVLTANQMVYWLNLK
jgi:hypothetical protein